MYLKELGKILLGSTPAQTFFENELWPLFFDHPTYFVWLNNSPFVQTKPKKYFELTKEERQSKLNIFIEMAHNQTPDASFAPGYPPKKDVIEGNPDPESVFLSWIGYGLCLGVKSGLSFQIANHDLLQEIRKGWVEYRKCIDKGLIEDKRLLSWNSHWIVRKHNFNSKKLKNQVHYIDLIFELSNLIPDNQITAHIQQIAKQNRTIGFLSIDLDSLRNKQSLELQSNIYFVLNKGVINADSIAK
ncbi:MAG: hypothetical protein VYB44_07255 [Bacteroidota bacterium]|nr:hypothetical protein [Bacteroidota bacterium]